MSLHTVASIAIATSPVPAQHAVPEVLAPPPVMLVDVAVATQPVPEEPPAEGDISAEAAPPEQPAVEPQAEPETPIDPDSNSVIVVEGIIEAPPGDPLHRVNVQTYEVVQEIDDAIVDPISDAYRDGLPRPVRKGLSNFFRNLREPIVFLNFLLQGKPGKAFETMGRFAINTTVGIAGLVDVAKKEPFSLPHRNNGFANTLGYYGVKPGAFLYLPLVGPTTIRDGIGSLLDTAVLPVAVGKPFNTPYYAVSSYTIRSLDERIELEEKHARIRDADFPYAAMRETYLCERQAEIDALRNRPVADCSLDVLFPDNAPPLHAGATEPEETMPDTQPAPAGSADGDLPPPPPGN